MNLYLVRHAHAGDRSRWNGPDAERPLSAKGRDQADDITQSLSAEPIARVLSSPATRCVQTVEDLAAAKGLTVEIDPRLFEGSAWAPVRALLDELKGAEVDAVICSHGDVLPELLDVLRSEGVELDGAGCSKGSIWHVVASNGRFERATYHRHPEPGLPQER